MVARIGMAAALLGLVLRSGDTAALLARFTRGTLAAVALGTVLLLASQAIAAWRWRLLIGPGAPRWPALFHLYLVGAFFSLFLPTAVGGDAFRATMLARVAPRAEEAVVSVVLDRGLGVVALLAYALAGVVVAPEVTRPLLAQLAGALSPARLLPITGAALLLLLGAALLARRVPRLRAIPGAALRATRDTLARGRLAAAALGLSLVVQGLMVLLWMVVARGVGLTLPATCFLVGVPLVSLATMLPLSLAGLGVREWAWVWFLAPFGVPAADAVALSLAYFACPFLAGAVGGLVFATRGAAPSLMAPARRAEDSAGLPPRG